MKSESIKQDTCTYVLTVSGKQPLFSVGHWQNVCKKLAGILIFFYLEENRSNKSDELALRVHGACNAMLRTYYVVDALAP